MSIPIMQPQMRGKMLASTSYQAASRTSVEIGSYRPPLRDADGAILPERRLIDTRMRDMDRNSGWVHGGVTKKLDKVVGAAIKPKLMPDWTALGITYKQATELRRQMEGAFKIWARDPRKNCDAARKLTFGQIVRVLYAHWIIDGRCVALPLWLPRYGATFRTAIQVVDPMRLTNPNSKPDSRYLKSGIELDQYGGHVAFNFQKRHPGTMLMGQGAQDLLTWERVPAYTRWGRPRVIYGYEQRLAEQTQGVSQLVSVLKKSRMLENYDDLELHAAATSALLAFAVKSNLPSEQLFGQMFGAPDDDSSGMAALEEFVEFTQAFRENNPYSIEGVKVQHLAPGEEIQQIESKHPNGNFTNAQAAWLRYLVNGLPGLSFEELANEFSKTSYVGIRAAFNTAWKSVEAEREMFSEMVLTPIVDLVIEEAIDLGLVQIPEGAPPYELARALYLNVWWVGPGRGQVDPLKEANARKVELTTGQITLEDHLAEDGVSAEEHLAQLAEEERIRRELELPSIFENSAADTMPADEPEDTGTQQSQGGEF